MGGVRSSTRWWLLAGLLAASLAAACGGGGDDGSGATPVRRETSAPEPAARSGGGAEIIVGEGGVATLQDALDAVQPGMRIVLRAGTYPSEVETVRSGPVTIVGEEGVVLSGEGNELNGPRIVHDGYTLERIEIADTNEGLRVENAKDVTIRFVKVHGVNNECVRFRFDSEVTLEDSEVYECGLEGNGEGVYVGLAPEQQEKFDGKADGTFAIIRRLRSYDVSEGVDVKENARAIVEDSEIWDAWDEKSGAIDFRSDGNEAYRNILRNNAGAGIRIGGDKRNTTDDSECDGTDCWGASNILRDNVARDNEGAGYRMMWSPQDIDCSNTGEDNDVGLFAYGSDVEWRVPCG